MRVLLGPRIDLLNDAAPVSLAWALAGTDGTVISLQQVGVKNLSRPLTQAEVALLRGALRGQGEPAPDPANGGVVVGYVCRGFVLAGAASTGAARAQTVAGNQGDGGVVAVTDHVNLTWRSPLTGRNHDDVGPRFPSMTGIYATATVLERVGAEGGIIVTSGVVAGVGDDGLLSAYESETARAGQHSAVSSELVPVAIVAAHMGLQIAAAVMTKVGR
jgi:purine-nucleoside phosphorylase